MKVMRLTYKFLNWHRWYHNFISLDIRVITLRILIGFRTKIILINYFNFTKVLQQVMALTRPVRVERICTRSGGFQLCVEQIRTALHHVLSIFSTSSALAVGGPYVVRICHINGCKFMRLPFLTISFPSCVVLCVVVH